MKKENCFAVAGIILLLILGYCIPSVFMKMTDEQRTAASKSFQIEEIQLDFTNVNIEEELEIFPEMLLNEIVIEQGQMSISISPSEDLQSTEEDIELQTIKKESQIVLESVNVFLDVLCPESEIEFVDFKAEYYVMMVSSEDKRVYPIWICFGVDNEEREYRIWLDDISKKVMAFEVPFEVMGMTDKEFLTAMERLGEYYGCEVFALSDTISNVYKIKTWQNTWMTYNKEEKEKNSIYIGKMGERFWFNVYPESVSFSNKMDKSSD